MIKTACEDLWKYQADNLISCTFMKDENRKQIQVKNSETVKTLMEKKVFLFK